MNYELDPILLDSEFDLWICENLMYQPINTNEYNWYNGQPTGVSTVRIKDSGKSGSERIYRTLKQIEKLKGIKL